MGDQLVSGADASGVGQSIKVLDVIAAVVPNLRWIWRRRKLIDTDKENGGIVDLKSAVN